MLRKTARRKVDRQESGHVPLAGGEDTNTPSKEVESALAALNNLGDGIDFLYRSKLYAAITSLPPEERRVVMTQPTPPASSIPRRRQWSSQVAPPRLWPQKENASLKL